MPIEHKHRERLGFPMLARVLKFFSFLGKRADTRRVPMKSCSPFQMPTKLSPTRQGESVNGEPNIGMTGFSPVMMTCTSYPKGSSNLDLSVTITWDDFVDLLEAIPPPIAQALHTGSRLAPCPSLPVSLSVPTPPTIAGSGTFSMMLESKVLWMNGTESRNATKR